MKQSRQISLVFLIAFLWLFLSAPVLAEKNYASDQVEVLLRKGPSNQHAIVRVLKTGAVLDVLEYDRNKGYTKVKTNGGTVGWVLARHLMAEPAARELLKTLSSQFAQEDDLPESADAQAGLIKTEYDALVQRAVLLEENNQQLTADLAKIKEMAGNAVQLHEQNQQMQQLVAELRTKFSELEQENQVLNQRVEREWFYAGALVLFFGLFLGLVIPRIRWRKRSRYSDFE